MDEPVKAVGFREKYQLTGKIIFIYGGNIGFAQDMMNIVRLANNIKNYKNAHFVVIGDGDEFNLVRKKIDELSLENILLKPSVPQKEYQEILSQADIGLFTLSKDHTTHNFPGKILSYMSHGLPILGSVNKDNDIIDVINNINGYISLNGDDEIFRLNAIKLLNNYKLRIVMGKKSREILASTFSVENAHNIIMESYPNKS